MNEIIFTESARELRNPERGFYNLYAFLITDEKADYMRFVEHYYKKDIDTDLTLIELIYRSTEMVRSVKQGCKI